MKPVQLAGFNNLSGTSAFDEVSGAVFSGKGADNLRGIRKRHRPTNPTSPSKLLLQESNQSGFCVCFFFGGVIFLFGCPFCKRLFAHGFNNKLSYCRIEH